MKQPVLLEPPPNWTPAERPMLPGPPAAIYHRPSVRAAYAAVGVLVGITGGLGNALVSANLPQIQGQLGLTPSEGAWLPAAYVMVNVTSNLLLFKFRQQFGIRRFAELGIFAYVMVTLLHVVAEDYSTALFARAISGFAAAPMSSLGLYYMNGRGVEASEKESHKWTLKAAKMGCKEAQMNASLGFSAGRGVEKDEVAAVKWLTKAAKGGLANACGST